MIAGDPGRLLLVAAVLFGLMLAAIVVFSDSDLVSLFESGIIFFFAAVLLFIVAMVRALLRAPPNK